MTKPDKPVFPKTDSRLLGRWEKDGERTLKEFHWNKGKKPIKKRKAIFRSLWKNSTVTYSRTKVTYTNDQFEIGQSYTVIGVDDTSVAIVTFGKPRTACPNNCAQKIWGKMMDQFAKPKIQHLHFEKDSIWIFWGRNREFYRRVPTHQRKKKDLIS